MGRETDRRSSFPRSTSPRRSARTGIRSSRTTSPCRSNTATAFSPTDVSAIRRWAKLLMILESTVSLALATLVVAKAINSSGS